jgi:hypothetical protein
MLTEEQAKVKYLKYKQKYLQLKETLENEQVGGLNVGTAVGFPNGPETAVGFPNEPISGNPIVDFFVSPMGMAVASTAAYMGYQGMKKAANWLFGSTSESTSDSIVDELSRETTLPSKEEDEQFFDAVDVAINSEPDSVKKEYQKTKLNNLLTGIATKVTFTLPGGSDLVDVAIRRLPSDLLASLNTTPTLKSNTGSAFDQLKEFLSKPISNQKDYSTRLYGLLFNYMETLSPSSLKPSLQSIFSQIKTDQTKQKYFIETVQQITKQPF